MWSDRETSLDLCGISYLTGAVKRSVLNSNLLPLTIGIFGDWGSGKSSLASIIKENLEKEPDIVCLAFNGWLFEGYEDTRSALMGTILDKLVEERKALEKAKDLVKSLRHRVDWFRATGLATKVGVRTFMAGMSAASLDPATIVSAAGAGVGQVSSDDIKGILRPKESETESLRKGIREFRNDFAKLLEKTGIKTLVVFIDDLDRCLPDTIVETLEALRLFLYTPRTAFVICADERLVRSAVQRRYPQQGGAEFDVATEYLEKLVQIPIRIPSLSPPDVRRYMSLLFAEYHLGTGFATACEKLTLSGQGFEGLEGRELVGRLATTLSAELDEGLALVEQVGDVLGAGLNGNPRQIKRFLNTMVLRMEMAKDRGAQLKRRVLAKLMVLEYVKNDSFRQLAEWQAEQSGRPTQLQRLEEMAREVAGQTRAERSSATTRSAGKKSRGEGEDDSSDVTSSVDPAIQRWRTDPWLWDWVRSDPLLSGEDLRPYLHVSRDRLGTILVPGIRLSEIAQKIVHNFLSSSKAIRTKTVEDAGALSPHDAVAVFQALAERARQTESLDKDDSPLYSLIELVKVRSELGAGLVQLLNTISPTTLGAGTPPRVAVLKSALPQAAPSIDALFERWRDQQSNTTLSRAAASMLTRRAH